MFNPDTDHMLWKLEYDDTNKAISIGVEYFTNKYGVPTHVGVNPEEKIDVELLEKILHVVIVRQEHCHKGYARIRSGEFK